MGRGRTGDTGNFLERKVSRTLQRTLLKGYRSNALSRGILPAAKLWWIFGKVPQKSASSLLSDLFKNPPEFHLCEAKFCPRQEVKALDIKAKFADRTSAPLNRTLAERKVFTRSLFESLGQAFSKACGVWGGAPRFPSVRRSRASLKKALAKASAFLWWGKVDSDHRSQ